MDYKDESLLKHIDTFLVASNLKNYIEKVVLIYSFIPKFNFLKSNNQTLSFHSLIDKNMKKIKNIQQNTHQLFQKLLQFHYIESIVQINGKKKVEDNLILTIFEIINQYINCENIKYSQSFYLIFESLTKFYFSLKTGSKNLYENLSDIEELVDEEDDYKLLITTILLKRDSIDKDMIKYYKFKNIYKEFTLKTTIISQNRIFQEINAKYKIM
ncbi:hypothetical protein MXB_4608, partial [Myxobolus squamalis]